MVLVSRKINIFLGHDECSNFT